jgi:nucleoside-diphosphate-sugar epimerase
MAKDLVLLTGVTGFVGSRALITALEAGYKVRAVLRRESAIDQIKSLKRVQPYVANVEFVVVKDLTAPNAYDSALQGVKYVLHIASPLPQGVAEGEDIKAALITPAVNATLNILRAAKKLPDVKRVVITSSVVANVPFANVVYEETDKVFDADSRLYNPEYSNAWDGYGASKVEAFNATWKFVEEEKPSFEVIQILPGPIVGPGELYTSRKDYDGGMNKPIVSIISGEQAEGSFSANTVHVADVAELHVLALNPAIEGNTSYMATAGGLTGAHWNDAIDIVKKEFPDKVSDGTLPNNGSHKTSTLRVDASKTEKEFGKLGFRFKEYPEQVRDLVSQYVTLKA